MPIPTDERQEDRLNPGQQDYDRRFNDLAQAEERGTFGGNASNSGQGSDGSPEDIQSKELQNSESSSAPYSGWNNNVKSTGSSGKKIAKAWFKRKGPLAGIGGGLGIVGIVLGFFSGAALPVSLMQNITGFNDSSSTSMSRRAVKTLQHAMTANPVECTSVKIKCNMGRLSNSALKNLEKKGLKPQYINESTVNNLGKRTGYPSRNPDSYLIEIERGKEVSVPAAELRQFLVDNPKFASKVFGVGGAFNLRYKAWTGKHISSRLYKVFGLNKNGGIADGQNKKVDGESFKEKTLARLKERIPGSERLSEVSGNVKAKVEPHLNKAKKGGVGYTAAVASCIGIKAPAYIAGGVAAIQLAQILPIVNDTILSPGAKVKANKATVEDGEAVGVLLTDKTPRKSDGKMTSALDSQYLQAALGINKNKTTVSKDFAPGYGFLTSPVVKASIEVDKKTGSSCNAIMSPAAMYTALAVDSAVTVAASATIVGGVAKVIGSFVITQIAVEVTKDLVGEQAEALLVSAAQNDKIPTAEGEELGDILGISGAAYFSAGGMARNLPALKTSQVSEYVALQQEDEAFQKEMDIASLSPFDTSSKYTFLGSIVNKVAMTAVANGTYGTSPLSLLNTLAKMPFAGLTTPVSAATTAMENYCGYADEFGLSMGEENAGDSPAINMAGLPCTGITQSQASMSTDEAISLMASEGWLDESKSFADNATIDDLLTSGYIKGDTPLADFIETCSHAESGDYLFNAGGCTVNSSTKSTEAITSEYGSTCYTVEEKQVCAADSPDFATNTNGGEGVKNNRSLEAMSVFLLDYQIMQAINGEDEGEAAAPSSTPVSGGVSTGRPENAIDLNKGWSLQKGVDYSTAACAPGTEDAGIYTHPVQGFKFRKCTYQGKPVNALVSATVVSMVEAAKAEGTTLTLGNSFRSYEEQQAVYARNCRGGSCSPPTATPGASQHERGLAIDFNACSTRATDCYKWLAKNAATYGYYNLESEPWHWSMSGY